MTPSPKSIDPDELAVTALRKMEEHQITVLVSCGPDGRPTGAVHLHDLLKAGLV
jgi:arabinose-5-phosphate isomerase